VFCDRACKVKAEKADAKRLRQEEMWKRRAEAEAKVKHFNDLVGEKMLEVRFARHRPYIVPVGTKNIWKHLRLALPPDSISDEELERRKKRREQAKKRRALARHSERVVGVSYSPKELTAKDIRRMLGLPEPPMFKRRV
jgi:hypothetical protein